MEQETEVNSTDEIEITEAINRLSLRLHDRMEHLDPTLDGTDWNNLSEHQKEFYRLCVEDLLTEKELLLLCLS